MNSLLCTLHQTVASKGEEYQPVSTRDFCLFSFLWCQNRTADKIFLKTLFPPLPLHCRANIHALNITPGHHLLYLFLCRTDPTVKVWVAEWRGVCVCVYVCVKSLSHVRLLATPWTVARQAPLSMGFSRQEYWSGLPFPSPGDLPNPGIKPRVSCIAGRCFILWATREAKWWVEITTIKGSHETIFRRGSWA